MAWKPCETGSGGSGAGSTTGNRFSLDRRARLKDVALPLMWSIAVRRMVGWGVDD